jgi:hypothetical protein
MIFVRPPGTANYAAFDPKVRWKIQGKIMEIGSLAKLKL